ncbi:nucleoside deaminase [Helicobacter burdigaliensis]|uniref:nucleoside deaminase n=1 Tax=Helicobacter burdigaliensis TaxID=2315334 RepID=UPI000EF6D2D2|nr:deaminase [Helicobacter burdigaliensis]
MKKLCFTLIFVGLFLSNAYGEANSPTKQNNLGVIIYKADVSASAERDHIYSLLSLAIVYENWQVKSKNKRGHNIGSVIVDNHTNKPVFWARNSVDITHNGTQHGEVRLATNLLNCQGFDKYLKNYTLYTTLEPCIMCTGMLSMVQIPKVVYVQKDVDYGNTQEMIKSAKYPRSYEVYSVDNVYKQSLEKGFEKYKSSVAPSVTAYLLTDEAKKIYENATKELQNYQVKFKENQEILEYAQDFLKNKVKTKNNQDVLECPKL